VYFGRTFESKEKTFKVQPKLKKLK